MKRFLLALVPWMVLVGSANAQVRDADVQYTHHDEVLQRAMRVGDECFVPIDGVSNFGWTVRTHGEEINVEAEGKIIHASTRAVGGRPSLPLRKIVKELGGQTNWIAATDTLSVTSPVTDIEVHKGELTVKAPLAVKASFFYLSDPGRVVVDLQGAVLTPTTHQELEGAELIQFKPNVVRIVIAYDGVPKLPAEPLKETRDLEYTILKGDPLPTEPPPPPVPANQVAPPITVVDPNAPLPVTLVADDASGTRITVGVGGQIHGPVQVANPDSLTLSITLPFVKSQVDPKLKLATDWITGVSSKVVTTDTVLTLTFSHPMGAQVSATADTVTIVPSKPVANGHLAGKVIVVDPGHGGHDSGAKFGDLKEKDLNLAIGRQLAAKLAKAGATVIMTRETDVFIPLGIRCDIANRNNADLFVSCHINSTGGSGSQSGTITFHHLGRPDCRTLAANIQAQIAKVNGLPNLGVWSDGRIYYSGFAVLRGTRMPGVLLELGFINTQRDRRRMITPEFQDSVTTAVVKGLKDYLGDRSE